MGNGQRQCYCHSSYSDSLPFAAGELNPLSIVSKRLWKVFTIFWCETEHELSQSIRTKLARFRNVKEECVIQSIDASTIYDVPNLMLEEGLDKVVLKQLNLNRHKPNLTSWNTFLKV